MMAIIRGLRRLLERLGLLKPQTAQEELRGAIEEGDFVKKDRDMLGGILDLSELEVFDVMVHRTKMVTVDVDMKQDDIIKEVLESGHSRVPAWEDRPDNIIGTLHVKDLFAALLQQGGDTTKIDIQAIVNPPWFVPDTRRLSDQLTAFLRRKNHFALAVDEYGEVMGLVTLEDVLEEIVGDISDEHDSERPRIRKQKDGSVLIDGAVPIRDVNRTLDWHLPDSEVTTVAGLVIHEARMIPETGQVFTFHGFRFEVLRKRRHQITTLRVMPTPVE